MTGDPAPDKVTAAIVGERRAHQYLRLLDLGRRAEADALLEPLDDRALGAVAIGLARIARNFISELPEREQQARAVAAQNELAEQLRRYLFTVGVAGWVAANGAEALRVIAEAWPDRAKRLHFYETMARATFDAEEPDSEVRRKYFRAS